MKKTLIVVLGVLAAQCAAREPFSYAGTLRLDYFHRGGPGGEVLSLESMVADGPWPGSRTQLIDRTGLGAYMFEVIGQQSGDVIYSRGFSSVYGEWITTPDVAKSDRTFRESLRFPWPIGPVRIILKKRDARNVFQPFWSVDVDPSSASDQQRSSPSAPALTILENGPSRTKVDVLLIGAGYAFDGGQRFRAQAERLVNHLFDIEPFKSRKSAFNVRTLEVSADQLPIERSVFGIARYMLASDEHALRRVAGNTPYDVVAVLVDDGDYGGGGIFNLQSTVAAGNTSAEYVFVHEFAHNFSGLGDEYVGNVSYTTGVRAKVEPWEPNLTALLNPLQLKWRELVEAGTPLPTPMSFAGKVGAFEGGGYEAKGLYRGETDCIMFSQNPVGFCRVCQRAIARVIDAYTR